MANFTDIPTAGKSFLTLARKNDMNGNPFRMAIVYDADGNIILCIEARSSRPNFTQTLRDAGIIQLSEISVTPAEYNSFKTFAKNQSILEASH